MPPHRVERARLPDLPLRESHQAQIPTTCSSKPDVSLSVRDGSVPQLWPQNNWMRRSQSVNRSSWLRGRVSSLSTTHEVSPRWPEPDDQCSWSPTTNSQSPFAPGFRLEVGRLFIPRDQ